MSFTNRLRKLIADAIDPTKPTLVHPDQMRPGDVILVECQVYADPDDYPPGSHVHATPLGAWNGDPLWTWSTRQRSRPDPWIPRL